MGINEFLEGGVCFRAWLKQLRFGTKQIKDSFANVLTRASYLPTGGLSFLICGGDNNRSIDLRVALRIESRCERGVLFR